MTASSRHWVCAVCERVHEAEPLRCECGGAKFTRVDVDAIEGALGFSVEAEAVERAR